MAVNVTNAAETNIAGIAQMSKVREVDFVTRFSHGVLQKLIEVLGVTRKVPMQEGTTMYIYRTAGTLESGEIPEGEIIPLSRYARTKEAAGDITLKKWRKATTAEAIEKSGYREAVNETDAKMLSDVQKGIRGEFFAFLSGLAHAASGTEGQSGYVPAAGVLVSGATLQAVLAKSWGQLQVLFENDAVEAVHFINPLTIADTLATANITTQTAFGMNYIRDFLGLGTVVMTSQVPQNAVYSTAKENLILYYLTMNGEIAQAFGLTTDESGYIGAHVYPNEARAQVETLVMSGVKFLVEYADGVVKGTVESE